MKVSLGVGTSLLSYSKPLTEVIRGRVQGKIASSWLLALVACGLQSLNSEWMLQLSRPADGDIRVSISDFIEIYIWQ